MLRAFLLIVVGLAGDPEHGELFHKWGAALMEASAQVGVPADRVMYLVDQIGEGDTRATGRSTRDEIRAAFDAIGAAATAEDAVYIVLIGHGSYNGGMARFNLPGPDIGPGEISTLVGRLPTRNVVFVNTASSSGPFVAELSAPGRTIITATRSGAEQYTTLFGGFFVEAFSTEAADADKNKRLSMLEAFQYAKNEVTRTYEREGLLATEHALLDDNGDKEGSQAPSATGADGPLAASLSLGSVADIASLPADPALRALHVERRDLERRVEALRLLKASMDPAKYAGKLERIAIELALKTREIRTLEGAQNNE
jgi:hypothetical protein